MVYLLILIITILGHRQWWRKSKLVAQLPSLGLFLGMATGIVLMWLACELLHLSLTQSSWMVLVSALVGFAKGGWRWRSELSWRHPVIALPLAAVTLWLIFGPHRYFPYEWDEFSAWFLMPKQMWVFESLRNEHFPIRHFLKYTPGWMLWVAYPTFLTGSAFEDHYHIWASFLPGVAAAGLAFDFAWLKLRPSTEQKSAVLIALWFFLLVIIRLKTVFTIYPSSLLIEFAQIPFLFAFFVTLLWLYASELASWRSYLVPGFLLAAAYLLKSPSLGVGITAFFLIPWQKWGWRGSLAALGATFAPALLAVGLWHYATAHVILPPDTAHTRIGVVDFLPALFSGEALHILIAMVKGALTAPFLIICLGAGIFLWRRGQKSVALAMGSWILLVGIGLFWLYLAVFSKIETDQLSGFERYMGVPTRVSLVCCLLLAISISREKILHWLQRPTTTRYLRIALVIVIPIVAEQMQANYHNHSNGRPNVFHIEAAKLRSLVHQRNLNNPNVWMIAQSYWRDRWREAISQTLEKPAQVVFTIDMGSWVADPNDQSPDNRGHVLSLTPDEFLRYSQKFQIIWPAKLDTWTRTQLAHLVDPGQCHGDIEQYFLVRDDNKTLFNCVAK